MGGALNQSGRLLVLYADRGTHEPWRGRLAGPAVAGWSVSEATGLRQAETALSAGLHDVVLVLLADRAGADRKLIDLVGRLSESAAVVAAGAGTETRRRELMIAGACDALPAAAGERAIASALARAAKAARALDRVARYDPSVPLVRQIGADAAIEQAIRLVEKAAGARAPVLVSGEPGTGKSIVARAIHERSTRRGGPFVRCLLRGIDPGDLASTLYGDVRRPGLYELAGGGTLYVEDVASLPPIDRARLLETLKGKAGARDGFRLIAATSRDLARGVRRGRFDRALWDRIRVIPIELPPLRERPADLPVLATVMVDRAAARRGAPIIGFTPGAVAWLQLEPWRWNLRELDSVIEAAVARAQGPLLEEEDLTDTKVDDDERPGALEFAVCLDETLPLTEISRRARAAAEIAAIRRALERSSGNVSHAARTLKVSRAWLQKRMKRYGLGRRS